MARITVVDDYPDFLDLVCAILDGLDGHEVAGFDGKETTIEDVVASDPELVIVDLPTPGDMAPGVSSVVLGRAEDRLRHVPVIICSGDVESLERRADEFAAAGAFMLQKPFAIEQLIATVFEALNRSDGHPRSTGFASAALRTTWEDESRALALDASGQ